MILVTKLNDALIAVNCDMIRSIEETPDTVITMSDYSKLVVRESMEDVIEKIVEYRRRIRRLVETEYERKYRT